VNQSLIPPDFKTGHGIKTGKFAENVTLVQSETRNSFWTSLANLSSQDPAIMRTIEIVTETM